MYIFFDYRWRNYNLHVLSENAFIFLYDVSYMMCVWWSICQNDTTFALTLYFIISLVRATDKRHVFVHTMYAFLFSMKLIPSQIAFVMLWIWRIINLCLNVTIVNSCVLWVAHDIDLWCNFVTKTAQFTDNLIESILSDGMQSNAFRNEAVLV